MRVRVGGRRHNHHRRAAGRRDRAPRHWGRRDHRFLADGRERKRHWPPTTDSADDHRDWRQRRRQDHLVQAAPARVAGSLLQPRCDRAGHRRLEQRRESTRSRPHCERRHTEAPRAKRGLRGFESTYSGRSRPRIVRAAASNGYAVRAVFIGTNGAEINIERVRQRVRSGTGHDVPLPEIRRRWSAAQKNLAETAASLGAIDMLDNSHGETRHVARITRSEIRLPATPTPAWARTLIRQIEQHRPTT